MRRRRAIGSAIAASTLLSTVIVGGAGTALAEVTDDTCEAPAPQTFEMAYVDTARAGGEPLILKHPAGHLLWGSHAGTTHFYSPEVASVGSAAFVQNYEGQTYYYRSDDGESWDFSERTPVSNAAQVQVPTVGAPFTGFSDPEFAIEQDGTVYVSEINLANVAVSKSEDGGLTYDLVNVFSFTSSDRQWMAADGDGELYMTANGFGGGSFPADAVGNLGHFMAKSTDGGLTWGEASTTNDNGVGDIQIDHARGFLYEMSVTSNNIAIARFPNIRNEDTDFTVEIYPIDSGAGLSGVQRLIGPTFDMDDEGNLYAVWEHNGNAEREAGIYFAAAKATEAGEPLVFSEPVKVDLDEKDDVWPWIAVGDPGNVAITWLQSSEATNAQLGGEAGGDDAKWNVMVASTTTAFGCEVDDAPAFTVATASSEPIHTGTICQHGTTCQADLTDRRLGDYHSIEVGTDGRVHVAVSDTRQGGAVALPLHIRQTDGPLLVAGPELPVVTFGDEAGDGEGASGGTLVAASDSVLAATGGGAALAAIALLGLGVGALRSRED